MPLAKAFRELREAWFRKTIFREPHEREWEDLGAKARRSADNAQAKRDFDEETEVIIARGG